MIPRVPFYFLRHGETDWNVAKRMQGRTDIPLNENGRAQGRRALERLRNEEIELVVASPQLRARETAEIVAGGMNLPLVLDARLVEKSFGGYEGLTWPDVLAEHGLQEHDDLLSLLPADAEPLEQARARVAEALNEWLAPDRRKSVLVVAHGSSGFRSVHLWTMGSDQIVSANATPYHFTPRENGWDMREV